MMMAITTAISTTISTTTITAAIPTVTKSKSIAITIVIDKAEGGGTYVYELLRLSGVSPSHAHDDGLLNVYRGRKMGRKMGLE